MESILMSHFLSATVITALYSSVCSTVLLWRQEGNFVERWVLSFTFTGALGI